MLAKTGPRTKRNSRRPVLRLVEDHGAGDVGGHQVGRELDALEADVEDLADRADHERLGQSGHADEQAVAAREDGGQDLLDDLALADDDAAELAEHLGAFLAELGEDLGLTIGGHRCGSWRKAGRLSVLYRRRAFSCREAQRRGRKARSARPRCFSWRTLFWLFDAISERGGV